MYKLLSVNITQFNEEEEDFSKYITDDGGLDVDSLVEDYKEPESAEENHQEVTTETEDEVEVEVEAESETDNSEKGEGGPESHEEEAHVNKAEKKTPDAAFAEMRRRAEQSEKYAQWVAELAQRQGFQEPDQLIEAFEKQQLAKEAQAKGVPVDVYERLQQLEKDNQIKEQEMFATKFNNEVEQTKEKYKLEDSQLDEVFQYMAQNGYVDQNGQSTISFEDAYILSNKETLVREAEERGRKAYLEEKKNLQNQATPNAGTGSEDKIGDDELDYSKEGIFGTLAKFGIEVD